MPKDELINAEGIADDESVRLIRLATLLRIAVVLHRNRTLAPLPHVAAKAKEDSLTLKMPSGWGDVAFALPTFF